MSPHLADTRPAAALPGVHAPAGEHVVRPVRVDGRGARERVAWVGEDRERLPADGKPIVGQPGEGVLVADQREHRLAAVAHDAGREHRLILDVRVDAESVDARDVGGGEDAGESGMALVERGAVAEGEARVRVGERTTRSRSAPAGAPSAPKTARPVTLPGPSTLGSRRPT